jgi:hypothetical protein
MHSDFNGFAVFADGEPRAKARDRSPAFDPPSLA